MTAARATPLPARRRGACPALSAPMRTGDGLLVRLVPASSALSPAALAGLARAAAKCGNGILEVTARGSLQLRGLSDASMDALNAAVRALEIAPQEGLSIALSPLSGLDRAELADARPLAEMVRAGLMASGFAARLGPKVSVVLDGGGSIDLDALKADVRLAARADGLWELSLAGDAASTVPDGTFRPEDAAERILTHLEAIARLGQAARMSDLVAPAPRTASRPPRADARPGHPIPLRDGTMCVPLALPFGAADSAAIIGLTQAAAAHGVRDLRPAPPRLLLATGILPAALDAFLTDAEQLGFIRHAADPRLSVAACSGAPLCASAFIPARSLAPQVAQSLAPLLDGSVSVHLSGCAKGCAHPAPATLTLVGHPAGADAGDMDTGGMDSAVALVRHGIADALPERILPLRRLAEALARMAEQRKPGERGAEILSRLDLGALVEPND
ncbi:precorrin-3B synthase [Aquabacter cavernae]|uniref:precorrin-3B synthase n=1 Tax=Aquabacter cavernae TaxID=2496029 RepID=UPI000F8CCFC5|nr:precorrin-3B synthase [Aquabacter cavernae]